MTRQRAILLILDGFGIGKDSPFNAINNAKMPFYKDLLTKYPHSQLLTHGRSVGLPDGVMGNSEVGHMTMGAGRIIYQDLSRISNSIADRSFFQNPVLRKTLQTGAEKSGRVHLMGLLSDGGVHSHIEHLEALLELCAEMQVPEISIHPFLDGRDTPPDSGMEFLKRLLLNPLFKNPPGKSRATIATLMGRYWGMDRDKRWERIEKAYMALTDQMSPTSSDPVAALARSYENGKSDEFVEPLLFDSASAMKTGDSVVFFNYRSDRAREISSALTHQGFQEFDRKKGFVPSSFAAMTRYSKDLTEIAVAFGPQNLDHIFGQWLEEKSLTQFRIAETEKYAHVTFFFNGGREAAYLKEDRLLVPSPKDCATYDARPEMSAFQIAEETAKRIQAQNHDFILVNFANADMVGHTGNYEAAVRAMEALDQCLEKVIGTAEKSNTHVILTADHGNAEEMRDEKGRIHTQHTLNPVPLIWVTPNSAVGPKKFRVPMQDGSLGDIMPTLCDVMGLPIPKEVTGRSLLPC
ncbi:MAG: 2,3-bisphosphoglycerate-independent phosphoglycerate mutase [Bdellovibrio sp.]|nr:2,3-bisphosphoglycerate-independent phosphoglycerate mutase [Bdellovibrio sp.]